MDASYFSHLSVLDWIIIVVFVISLLWGIHRGFVRDFFALLAWFCAFWILGNYHDVMIDWFNQQQLPQAKILVPIFVFLFSLLVFNICGLVFSELTRKADMGVIDTLCGLFTGAFRGFILSFILISFLKQSALSGKTFFQQSVFRPQIENTFGDMFPSFYADVSKWAKKGSKRVASKKVV
ncbi:CvpA family protein [Candidatus Ichthyocystis hellenicum]|uniref:CvpA family protein n=1 Tax=Candidatus Ichthyocystis hellenicum TaxID=1561003 RepID=UPI000B86D8E2|nr:CvpA family protein [Candidatus Ichthyocystis hellenicum]